MSQQNIDFGTFPNDPNADAIRIAFQKVQENFNQLFDATAAQSVLSINRLPGAGITVNSPIGNVIVTANVAQVQFSTSTLSLGRAPTQSPSAQDSSITSSSQTMYINLPTTIANVDIIQLNSTLIANTVNVNLSLNGNVGNFSGNVNGSNLSTSGKLTVTGNANVGNIGAETGIFTSNVAVTNNITSGNVYANSGTIGANTGAFANNITAGNVYANTGIIQAQYLSGDGSNISNVVALIAASIANGNSNVNIPVANGNINFSAGGNADVLVLDSTGNLYSNGNFWWGNIANISNQAAYTSVNKGALNTGVIGTGLVYLSFGPGNPNGLAFANSTATFGFQNYVNSNNSWTVDNNYSGPNGTNRTLTFTQLGNFGINNANPTTTFSVNGDGYLSGNLTAGNFIGNGSQLTGNLSAGNIDGGNLVSANYFSGNGANLSAITGANVTGTVANATYAVSAGSAGSAGTAGTVTTAAQPNITSVGTLSALDVTGDVTSGNVYANSGTIQAQYLKGDGSNIANIIVSSGSFISSGNSNVRVVAANSNVTVSVAGNANIITVTGTGANIDGYANITGNVDAGNVTATLLGGTLTTAAQPNITTVGTLTGLDVNGVSNLGSNSNIIITGGAPNYFLRTDGAGVLSWINATTLTTAPGSNTQVLFNDASSFGANANLTFDKITETLTTVNISATNGTFSNIAGALTTNAQPNITSVGTLTSLIVNGNINAANLAIGAGTILTYNLTSNGNVNFTQTSNVTLGNVSNLHISGGSNGYVLVTDGLGNLDWALTGSISNISNGNSNVSIPATDGNINFSSAGNANIVVVTGTGILRNSQNIPTFAYQASTPPSSPLNGDQWYNTVTGVLFEYLNDGTTAQWVDVGTIPLTTGVNATTLANGTSNVNIPVISSNITFATAGFERMRITDDGNVGIGNVAPTDALSVNGTVSATNFAGNGYQLTGLLPTLAFRTTTDNTSITPADGLILANGVLTISLPAAATVSGRQFYIKNVNSGNAIVTIVPVEGEFIDGKTNASIAYYNTMLGVISISTGWVLF